MLFFDVKGKKERKKERKTIETKLLKGLFVKTSMFDTFTNFGIPFEMQLHLSGLNLKADAELI